MMQKKMDKCAKLHKPERRSGPEMAGGAGFPPGGQSGFQGNIGMTMSQPSTGQTIVSGIQALSPMILGGIGAYMNVQGLNSYQKNYTSYINACTTVGVPCSAPSYGGTGMGMGYSGMGMGYSGMGMGYSGMGMGYSGMGMGYSGMGMGYSGMGTGGYGGYGLSTYGRSPSYFGSYNYGYSGCSSTSNQGYAGYGTLGYSTSYGYGNLGGCSGSIRGF